MSEVALYDADPDIRRVAAAKIDDEEMLLYIAENDEFPDVRKAATAKIDNGEALRSIMKYDENMDVQRTALQKLMEQEPDLLKTLLSDDNELVRRLAVEKITDEKKLLEISKKDSSVRVRITAIHVMSNSGYSWEEDYDFTMYTQWDCDECKESYVVCENITKEIKRIKRVFGL